jgi:hypothetical protein
MSKARHRKSDKAAEKDLVWLSGEVKMPPFTPEGRQEAGMLLRSLQDGIQLSMPQSELLPIVGPRCGALRSPKQKVI